jgi:hypothetical protein
METLERLSLQGEARLRARFEARDTGYMRLIR